MLWFNSQWIPFVLIAREIRAIEPALTASPA
jgi:hypothetical protein